MNKLDGARERYKQTRRLKNRHGCTWTGNVKMSAINEMHAGIGYLLTLLQPHPASKPPDTARLVIVRWRDKVSLGQGFDGIWNVRGWVVVDLLALPS